MGYDFYIGEAEIDPEDSTVIVKRTAHVDAPSFPGDFLTKNDNSRHPSYTTWVEFCRDEGLFSLFFNEDGSLYGGHPGTVRLTKTHQQTVRDALKRHRKRCAAKGAVLEPGWCECPKCIPFGPWPTKEHRELDGNLARLIWLDWWISWALEFCRIPTIYNH